MSYSKTGEQIRISVYIPPEFYQYAKDQKNITRFVQSAVIYYSEQLRNNQIIKTKPATTTVSWTEWFEKLVNYHISLSPCLSRSEFVRHAMFYYMKEEISLNKKAKEIKYDPLKDDEIRVNNGDETHTTYKILRRLE